VLLAKLVANTALVRGPVTIGAVVVFGLVGGVFARVTGGSFWSGTALGILPVPFALILGYKDTKDQFKALTTGKGAYLFGTAWGEHLTPIGDDE
jgi:hypothetical protein